MTCYWLGGIWAHLLWYICHNLTGLVEPMVSKWTKTVKSWVFVQQLVIHNLVFQCSAALSDFTSTRFISTWQDTGSLWIDYLQIHILHNNGFILVPYKVLRHCVSPLFIKMQTPNVIISRSCNYFFPTMYKIYTIMYTYYKYTSIDFLC